MEIIEKMPTEAFDNICDAGVELVKQLVVILGRFGLGPENAISVLAVATAGIAKGSQVETDDFVQMFESISPMWSVRAQNGRNGIVFDPVHRHPNFTYPVVDPSTQN